jgi:hypothetical protein
MTASDKPEFQISSPVIYRQGDRLMAAIITSISDDQQIADLFLIAGNGAGHTEKGQWHWQESALKAKIAYERLPK